MKNLTVKQEARLEKKKKKMAALTEIIKLNDRDGRKKIASSQSDTNNSSDETSSCNGSTPTRTPTALPVLVEASAPADTAVVSDLLAKRSLSAPTSTVGCDQPHEPSNKRLRRAAAALPTDKSDDSQTPTVEQPAAADAAPVISTLDYAAMKRSLSARKRIDRSIPKIRLKLMGDQAALSNSSDDRTPIFLTDVQHLVMGTVLGSQSPCMPYRWCHIERSAKVSHVVVLVVEGCSLYNYTAHESSFAFSTANLSNRLEVIMPADGHIVEELVQVPLTDSQSDELIDKYGSLEAAMESTRNQMLLVQTVFPVSKAVTATDAAKSSPTLASATDTAKSPSPDDVDAVEVVPRTQLLLSALQLVDEGYPIPLSGELANRYRNYVMTKDSYAPVTAVSPMFGLDCEMCRTSAGINELTRISIVDEQFRSIYETLVRPANKIVDYLTQYSGITGAMMLNVTKTREQVQQDVRALLPADAILVGQSLQSDLVAMQMMHPYVIDTSCIFNLSGERRMKSKLQALTLEFLGEVIQDNPLGHDSIEDCSASLKLTKLKLARGVAFGDAILTGRKRANEVRRQAENGAQTATADAAAPVPAKRRKTTALIAAAETGVDYVDFVRAVGGLAAHGKHIQCERTDSNKAAVRRTQEVAMQHDLTISHVRVSPERMATDATAQLKKVDRWIAKCWESVATNGLLIVLLGAGAAAAAATTTATADLGEAGGAGDNVIQTGSHRGVVLFDIKSSVSTNVEYRK